MNTKPLNSFWVAQKYIEKPLLYYGRKFDIRVWAIFTNHNEVFLYKKGYLRTSSFDYDMKNNNNYVHLTNNCLQKHGDNYGKHEEGNTLSFETFAKYLEEAYPEYAIDFDKQIYQRMRDLIIDTYLCWKKNLNPSKRKHCFELFGYDFLIDEDIRTWLLEVNTNPYLGVPNNYIADMLPKMLDDMFEIVLDPLIAPKNDVRNNTSNDYELIYCEFGSNHHPDGPFNARSPFNRSVYPIPELNPELKNLKHIKGNLSKEEAKEEEDAIGDIKGRASVEEKEKVVNNNIDAIFAHLYNLFYNKISIDPLYVQNKISRIFSSLVNWELLSDKQAKAACKALKLVAGSTVSFLLGDQKNLVQISNIIKSQNVKVEIQNVVLESLIQICKEIGIKKKIMCNKILHDLISISLESCDEANFHNHHESLRSQAIKLLENLSGFEIKNVYYIPGETREMEKLRKFFIAQGGLIAIMILAQKSLDENLIKISENLLSNLEHSDWEYQNSIIEIMKESLKAKNTQTATSLVLKKIDSFKEKENKENISAESESNLVESENFGKESQSLNEIIFYETGESFEKEKNRGKSEKTISFPR